jgi:DNA polymerase I
VAAAFLLFAGASIVWYLVSAEPFPRKRLPTPFDSYSQKPLNVAALSRYRAQRLDKRPRQDVRYVVVDDEARRTPDRVRLEFELDGEYDSKFYATALIRTCDSVVSPLGWDRETIRRYLRIHRVLGLSAFE